MAHAFGGAWTERKLSVVRRYLEIYARALKNQTFQRIYVDAFAGTGDRVQKMRAATPFLDLPEFDAVAKGSARIALEVNHHFTVTCLSNERPAERANLPHSNQSTRIATSKSEMLMRTMRSRNYAKRSIGVPRVV